MKHDLQIQRFGGRGQTYESPKQSRQKKRKTSNPTGLRLFNETLKEALGRQGKARSITEAMETVNKDRYSSSYQAYSYNCQRCVVAYELQRRGYDVVALPTYDSDMLPYAGYVGYDRNGGQVRWNYWQGAFRHAKPINVGASRGAGVIDNLNKKMGQYGDGSRGIIKVQWKDSAGGGGHVFNVERRNGQNIYVDAQTGERVNINHYMSLAKPSSVNLIRTDNLRISERAKNMVAQRKNYN